MGSLFDSTAYYRLSNDIYGTNYHINDGYNPTSPQGLVVGNVSFSSENWQIFYQDSVYFIRNYDYGASYQLGLTDDSRTLPQIVPATGDLDQQWNITIWPDGTRKLTNMAVGDFQYLGVSNDSSDNIVPAMNTADQGSHWTFDINTSAGTVPAAMVLQLSSVATPSATSSPTSPSTSISSASATSSDTFSGTSSVSLASSTSSNTTSSTSTLTSHSISTGAIIGIAIAAVVVLVGILVSGWFILRRQRRRRQGHVVSEMGDAKVVEPYYDITSTGSSAMVSDKDRKTPSEIKGNGFPVEIGAGNRRSRGNGGVHEMM